MRFSKTALLCATVTTGFSDYTNAQATIDAYYRADVMHNVSGGLKTGAAYFDDAGLLFNAALGPLFGASDAKLFVYLLHNNRTTFSDTYAGDLQGVSNIDAVEATRIYELWYEQNWSDEFSLRVGLYDLNSEFDAIDTAGLFLNSSHGIGAEYSQSGLNGPSIFPNTALAVRGNWQLNDASSFRVAVLDGVPGDPDDPSKTAIRLSSDEGALTALEYNFVARKGARFGVGGWTYSEKFDRVDGSQQKSGNDGIYGFVDAPLYSSSSGGLSVKGFLRYGVANDQLNILDSYLGGGVVMTGLLADRPDDQIGLAFGHAQIGSAWKNVVKDAGGRVDNAETNIEVTYRTHLNDWLILQPTIQYIANPSADPALNNAFVIGLRFELVAGKEWN